MKPFDRELVSGSITKSVWKLAWPVVLLNLVNGLHGFVDHVLVGHYVPSPDNEANAGIGIAWFVFLVMVVFISSLYHGMRVLIARYAGMRDRAALSRVAYHTFLTSMLILAAMAPLGYVLAPHLLRWANAQPAVLAHAVRYLRVLFTCGWGIFLMFMVTGAMQASGDPRTPLALGVLATVLNIILSAILITGAGPAPRLGVAGAALATCLAPAITVIIALVVIYRGGAIIQPPPRYVLVPDWSIMRPVARIGLPTGLQAVLLNLGGLFLLRYIGSLEHSAAAQAAYTICYAQLFSAVTWASWGLRNAASTIIGQNMGAGDPARGRKGVHVAAVFGAGWALAMGILYATFPHALLGLFSATDAHVTEYGSALLRYLSVSGVFLAVALSYTGGLIGAGDTRSPLVISVITQIVVLLGLCQIWSMLDRLNAEAVWSFILIGHALRLVVTLGVFQRGTWQHRRVGIDQET